MFLFLPPVLLYSGTMFRQFMTEKSPFLAKYVVRATQWWGLLTFICCDIRVSVPSNVTPVKSHSSAKRTWQNTCSFNGQSSTSVETVELPSGTSRHWMFMGEFTVESDPTVAQCGQTFSDSSKLKGHLITHTDTKDHVCSVCRKAYKYSKTLKQHIKVHTPAVSNPFSRLLRKLKVNVVVTDGDAKVVDISDASKALNVKVKEHSNLPGENLPKLASGSIKFTNPSKLTVTAAETSNGSLTLNSSLCTTGITSLSSADLSSNIVSVCDPSESSSQIFSPSTDSQNSFPLSNSQVCNVNIDSTTSSPPSKPRKALSVNRNTKKKIIPFKPPHKMYQTILNPKTIHTNQTVHQTHSKQWELSLTHKMILILIKSPHPWSTVTKFSSSYNAVLTGECGELFCPRPCYCNPWSFK